MNTSQNRKIIVTMLKVQLLSENATVPKRNSTDAAGYDLYSSEDTNVPARGRMLIKTDVAIEMPQPEMCMRCTGMTDGTSASRGCAYVKCYGRIAARSGLALKRGLDVGAGVIDADYRNGVGVILFNHTDETYPIKRGDAIAQLILELHITPIIEIMTSLSMTERGMHGFGSTDSKSEYTKEELLIDEYGTKQERKDYNDYTDRTFSAKPTRWDNVDLCSMYALDTSLDDLIAQHGDCLKQDEDVDVNEDDDYYLPRFEYRKTLEELDVELDEIAHEITQHHRWKFIDRYAPLWGMG